PTTHDHTLSLHDALPISATEVKETSAADLARQEEILAAIEDLRLVEEGLRAQNEALAASRQAIDSERLMYRELFDSAPDAYLITDRKSTRLNSSHLGISY